MDFIYPTSNSSIYVVVDENNKTKDVVFELSHSDANSTIYWHLDDELIGITKRNHQLAFIPQKGKHKLTVVDQNGDYKSIMINVIN